MTEIIDQPYHVTLFGFGGAIGGDGIGATGRRSMDRMWQVVRDRGIKTKGMNHWVYLPEGQLFTGVELVDECAECGELERIEVTLDRYCRHLHVGDYAMLPEVWPQLFARLKVLNEITSYPNLEIYGHWNPDPMKCETTIVIGLGPKQN